MKAIILSAGQGRRLLPLTKDIPKCMLPVQGYPMLEWQISSLLRKGIQDITVVVGFQASCVEDHLRKTFDSPKVTTLYNPFYAVSDNLASCWIARCNMDEDFILLNGDTLFEDNILERVLSCETHPLLVTIDKKGCYDADDMKVVDENGLLIQVGKNIPLDLVTGESIGLHVFRNQGPLFFCQTVERMIRYPEALGHWYLSVIDNLSGSVPVGVCSIEGMQWLEVDYPEDLERADRELVFYQAQQIDPI